MEPKGYWYVFRIEADSYEQYIGRVEGTSEGWDEMGCDLYPRLFEAGLIPDHELIEAAEADTDESIALIYRDRDEGYLIRFNERDVHLDPDPMGCLFDREMCVRWLDFLDTGDERNGWQCSNDHTGCLYNDGNNTCSHHGLDQFPLEEFEEST